MTAPPEVRERARRLVEGAVTIADGYADRLIEQSRTSEAEGWWRAESERDARNVQADADALRWLLTLIDREAPDGE